MIIKNNSDVSEDFIKEEGISKVKRKILIGPDDGSQNIIMRYFKVLPGGNTALHVHDHEHVVKIEKGRGVVINEAGEEIIVYEGQSLFIKRNEKHQFRNPLQETFEFLCIILNPEKADKLS